MFVAVTRSIVRPSQREVVEVAPFVLQSDPSQITAVGYRHAGAEPWPVSGELAATIVQVKEREWLANVRTGERTNAQVPAQVFIGVSADDLAWKALGKPHP